LSQSETTARRIRHDRLAPFWAGCFVILCATGLATVWIDLGDFWKGYVLDMTGPAWNYILFRGLFTSYAENPWTRFFTPTRTFIIFIIVCFGIETGQYFDLYDAVFDPLDLLAYVAILIPLYIVDLSLSRSMLKNKKQH
jgi:hypothetical protein